MQYFSRLIVVSSLTLVLFGAASHTSYAACGSDTMTDADGNVYGTVQVGTQCWMAENLRVGTRIINTSNQTNNAVIEKYCYSNLDANCLTDGGLYQWDEMMQYTTAEGAQGICPSGWHIPSDTELFVLENYLKDEGQACSATREYATACSPAGTKMASGGSSGLDFPLAGIRYNSSFYYRPTQAFIWSSTLSSTFGIYRELHPTSYTGVYRGPYTKTSGLSVRCIQSDTTPPTITLTPLNSTTNTSPVLVGNATDAIGTISSVEWQLSTTTGSWNTCTADDGTFNESDEDFSCALGSLATGTRTVYVRSTDSNSNTATSSDTFTILDTFTLSYDTRPDLVLIGSSTQSVAAGGDGSAVEVVPSPGYEFVEWSDGVTDNPRTDTSVAQHINVYPTVRREESSGGGGLSPAARVDFLRRHGNEDAANEFEKTFLNQSDPATPRSLEETLALVKTLPSTMPTSIDPIADRDVVKKLIGVLLELIEVLAKLLLQTDSV